jgi:hypothetical protein
VLESSWHAAGTYVVLGEAKYIDCACVCVCVLLPVVRFIEVMGCGASSESSKKENVAVEESKTNVAPSPARIDHEMDLMREESGGFVENEPNDRIKAMRVRMKVTIAKKKVGLAEDAELNFPNESFDEENTPRMAAVRQSRATEWMLVRSQSDEPALAPATTENE